MKAEPLTGNQQPLVESKHKPCIQKINSRAPPFISIIKNAKAKEWLQLSRT